MDGNPAAMNSKLRCSYHKDNGHRTKNCKTLKQFLEGLVSKSHLAEYVKNAKKVKRNDSDDSGDGEPTKKPASKIVTGVINAIYASVSSEALTKNAIRVHIKRD